MKKFITYLVIFLLSVFLVVSVRSCQKQKRATISAQNSLLRLAQNGLITPLPVIKTKVDTVWKTPVSTYEPTIAKGDVAVSGGISPAYIDSISRALNVASDRITSLTKANMNLNAKIKLIESVDSTGRLLATYKDKSFDIKYYTDSTEMDIHANVGLNFLDHKSRKHFLQPWHHYTEVWTTDPRFMIDNLYRVIREGPKSSRWGVDAFVGPSFSKEGMNVAFGIGIGYRIIEF